MIPCRDTDNDQQIVDVLTDAYRDKPITSGIARAIGKVLQRVEDMFWDVIYDRLLGEVIVRTPLEDEGCGTNPDTTGAEPTRIVLDAEGARLDTLGKLVGEPRGGRDDAAYRVALKLRIRVNRSLGRVSDIFEIVALALPFGSVWRYRRFGTQGFEVRTYEISAETVAPLAKAIGQGAALTADGFLVYSLDPSAECAAFGWDGSETGPGTFGYDTDNGTGGPWVAIEECSP